MAEIAFQLEPNEDHQLKLIVQLLATGLEQESFHAATTAVLARICELLNCSNASYGVFEEGRCTLEATSHSASVDERMNLARVTVEAMQEAISQDVAIVFPIPGKPRSILRAHTELHKQSKARSICTVPVNNNGQLVGAFLLEQHASESFDLDTMKTCELIAGLIGPVLDGKRREEQSLRRRLKDGIKARHKAIWGPQYPTLKLLGTLAFLGVVVLSTFSGEYKVKAEASLEGLVQRAVIAPMDGFILEAHARAGDEVNEGEVLAVLDDRDLQLERSQWLSEQQQILRSYRAALSEQDRKEVVILKARLDQVTAKLELSDKRLERSRIAAPLEGMLVSGDLSKSLGAPVERGEVLFEVAPMTDYRVMLKVDERSIGWVSEQQRGYLTLNGFPSKRFPFEITRITPMSQAEDGNNFFMVEAELDSADPLLRPGMQGVAKIEVGDQRLGWILTHEIIDWFRLWAWV